VRTVDVVVPAGLDDPRRPSGGNVYDRRVCNGLGSLGWHVREHHVAGTWPCPDAAALTELAKAVAVVPDDGLLLVDGLVASAAYDVLGAVARRLRLVVLVHLPLALPGEGAVLAGARALVTTSSWSRDQLLARYPLDPASVHVAEPGADRATPVAGTLHGGELLCVAPVSRHKGHDVLVAALTTMRDLPWRCRCVGSLERDPAFVADIRRQVAAGGLDGRVTFCGARTGADLAQVYAASDVLVHPSRGETYGMVVTEALARALPVLATDVGGVREALGNTPTGPAGLLVAADEPALLAAALRRWLTDEELRDRLRGAAARRRRTLPSWQAASGRVGNVLAEAAA
jgi:glycosyltransferase involved in cell wall biosynthesis